MPATRFTRRANTKAKKRQWKHVYDSVKAKGGALQNAIMAANAALRDHPSHKRS